MELGNANSNMLGKRETKNKYSLGEYVFDLNSENDSHCMLVREILKLNKKVTVLDVGCGRGLIGGFLQKYDNVTIDGMDVDEEAIEEAKKYNKYRTFYNSSIEKIDYKELPKYDVIVFGDLLEHLVKPYEVLIKMEKNLKKDGIILVSIPNIAHVDIIKNLINNNWNYNTVGLLDTTHLRFFTEKSFVEMIKNVNEQIKGNYDAEFIDATHIYPEEIDKESTLVKMINNDNKKYVLQIIIKLTVLSSDKEPKLLNKLIKENEFDNFSMISEYISDKEKCIEKQNEEIKRLKDEISSLSKEHKNLIKVHNKLFKEHESIVNSKRWKMINKIGDLKNKIIK